MTSSPASDYLLPRRLYGILGRPLGHSLSPLLHNWAFAGVGHPGVYFAWEKSREELPDFFSAVRTLPVAGLSVTIPHKQSVIEFLDALSPRAQSVGAVNTVYWRDNLLLGDNTDVAGFLAPLAGKAASVGPHTPVADANSSQHSGAGLAGCEKKLPDKALLLGGGGVSRAALAGLRELGIGDITVAVRSPEKARALEEDFRCAVIPWQQREEAALDLGPLLIINATPLGMRGENEGKSPLPDSFWESLAQKNGPESCMAYELIYSPVETPFVCQARAAGCRTLDGLSFFMAQAGEQFRLWTGSAWPSAMVAEARCLVKACV